MVSVFYFSTIHGGTKILHWYKNNIMIDIFLLTDLKVSAMENPRPNGELLLLFHSSSCKTKLYRFDAIFLIRHRPFLNVPLLLITVIRDFFILFQYFK
jgi:hypothetical protein